MVGRVVDLRTRRPLPGRLVAIGRARAVTDADGRFTMAGISERYDAVVIEPDRATASVFRGLHRRDPLLVHRGLEKAEGRHITDLAGTLNGGGPLEQGDHLVVTFLSNAASAFTFPTGPPPGRPGRPQTYPAYGPMRVIWRGPDRITGELVALLVPAPTKGARADAATRRPALLAHKTITLETGFVTEPPYQVDEHNCATPPPLPPPQPPPTEVPLDFAPIPWRHVAATVEARYLDSLSLWYRWPALDGDLFLPPLDPSHKRLPTRPILKEADVPDLAGLGAVLCLEAVDDHVDRATTCAFPQDGPVQLKPRPAPRLSMPPGPLDAFGKTILSATSRISWTPFEGGVHMLAIEAQFSSAEHPSVYVFTEETSAGWPDLAALGVSFPADFVVYDVGVTGFGPYASLDTAVAPDGLGAVTPPARYRAGSSGQFNAVLSPTGGPPDEKVCGEIPETACDPPPACDCGQRRVCICQTPCERVNAPFRADFWTANRLLNFHPGLAATAGVRCVHDCDGLRAFRVAFKRYAHQHPGFQGNEPIPGSVADTFRRFRVGP